MRYREASTGKIKPGAGQEEGKNDLYYWFHLVNVVQKLNFFVLNQRKGEDRREACMTKV